MKIRIEIDEATLTRLVVDHLTAQLGDLTPDEKQIRIEVKSKQNWKSEWETAAFRAVYEKG